MNSDITKETVKETKTLSIPLPKIGLPSLQAAILALLILVGILQTVQLFGLNKQIASANIGSPSNTISTSPSTASGASSASALPEMVGGC